MSIYTLSRNWKIFYVFTGLFWLVCSIQSLTNYFSWSLRDGLRFTGESVLAVLYFCSLFDNLAIDKEGFKYRSFGITYSGKWSDAQTITERRIFLFDWTRLEGFYIEKKKLSSGDRWILAKDIFVPLSQFSLNWRDSNLGQQVKEYLS